LLKGLFIAAGEEGKRSTSPVLVGVSGSGSDIASFLRAISLLASYTNKILCSERMRELNAKKITCIGGKGRGS
jgi:hypothetical protein